MNLLQVVLTNTSTLDTSLPALWYIRRQHPDASISILYCVGNRRQVLRDSSYVDEFCQANRITQLDLSDFLRGPRLVGEAWRQLNGDSSNDAFPVSRILENPRLIFTGAIRHVGMGFRRRFEAAVGERLLDRSRFAAILQPDVVFFDLREKSRFYGRDSIFGLLYEQQPITLLLPHSPHDITPHSEITSFDERGEYFPAFCRYWIAFKESRAYERFPERQQDFLPLGYPAFDSKWHVHLRALAQNRPKNGRKQCLILTRNFYPKDVPTPDGEWFTVPYQSVIEFLNRIADADERLGHALDFVIKPHPKASLPRTLELLAETRLKNWSISYESFYRQTPETDLVVASFTTSLLITQMYGIPTILIEDAVQRYVNRWAALDALYTRLSLYCRPEDDLAELVQHAITGYSPDRDVEHLRRFFPDGNLDIVDSLVTSCTHAV